MKPPCRCGRTPRTLEHRCERCPRLSKRQRRQWRLTHGFATPTLVERLTAAFVKKRRVWES